MDIRSFFGGAGKKQAVPAGSGAPRTAAEAAKGDNMDLSAASSQAGSKPSQHSARASPARPKAAAASKTAEPAPATDAIVLDSDEDAPANAKMASSHSSSAAAAAAGGSSAPGSASRGRSTKRARGADASDVGSAANAGATPSAVVDMMQDSDADAVMLTASSSRSTSKSVASGSASKGGVGLSPAGPASASSHFASKLPAASPATAPSPLNASASSIASRTGATGVPPPITGGREVHGTPGCLDGETVVVTGELENLSRDMFTAAVTGFGGRVTSAISGKTTILVHGSQLEDGRAVNEGSKWREAQQQNADPNRKAGPLRIFSEMGFYDYLESTLPASQRPARAGASASSSSAGSSSATKPSVAASAAGASSSAASAIDAESQLWTDKYKPSEFTDLVGNLPSVRALDEWVRHWEGRHVLGTEEKPKYTRENPGAKAALISGPPGIGKTTTASLIGRRYGYDVVELNASDNRAAKHLHDVLGTALDSSVLSFGRMSLDGGAGAGASSSSSSSSSTAGQRRLIIMDEVDGMSGGDRGGNAELIKLIKTTKVPIICICNDRQHPKVRSLANSCYDIKFMRPPKELIVKRMCQVAANEGMTVDPAAMDTLVESCGNDIRQILNTLQMWSRRSKNVGGADMKSRLSEMNKDSMLRLDAFTATPKLFTEANSASLAERIDLFHVDYDWVPLLVQQSYAEAINRTPGADDRTRVQRMLKAADCIADGDIFSEYIRSKQAWGLLPDMAISNVRAATYSSCPTPPMIPFPSWLGKNSSRMKRARLLAELGLHMAPHISAGRESIRLDYFDPLRTRLMVPLVASEAVQNAPEAAQQSIELLDEYGLSNTDLMETMMEVTFSDPSGGFVDYAKVIDSRVKAAFTREYKKTAHKAQSLGGLPAGAVLAVARGKKASSGSGGIGLISEEGEELEDEAVEEDEDGANDEDGDGEGDAPKPGAAAAGGAGAGSGRGRGGAARGRSSTGSTRGRGRGTKAAGGKAAKPAKTAGTKRKKPADSEDEDEWIDDSDSD